MLTNPKNAFPVAANDRFFKSGNEINKHQQRKRENLLTFYRKLQAIERDFERAQNDKRLLKIVREELLKLINSHSQLIQIDLPTFGISSKWPAIITRSISLYSTLSGLLLCATSLTIAAAAPLAVVGVYVIAKAREDISKQERSIRIEKTLVTVKEAVLDALEVPLPKVNLISSIKKDKSPTSQLKKALFNSTTRNVLGMTGTLLGIGGTLFALGIVTANPIGLIVAGSLAVIGAVSYGIYERYKKHKLDNERKQIIERQQRIQMREDMLEKSKRQEVKAKYKSTQTDLDRLQKMNVELKIEIQEKEDMLNQLKRQNDRLIKSHDLLLKGSRGELPKRARHACNERFFSACEIT